MDVHFFNEIIVEKFNLLPQRKEMNLLTHMGMNLVMGRPWPPISFVFFRCQVEGILYPIRTT